MVYAHLMLIIVSSSCILLSFCTTYRCPHFRGDAYVVSISLLSASRDIPHAFSQNTSDSSFPSSIFLFFA